MNFNPQQITPRPPPLQGVRVLDLSRVLAGPWCSQNLGDMGADVIKVERPGTGDDTRHWGPPYLKDEDGKDTAESAYYLCCNRNKRSIAADIATPEGAALVRELAQKSDVLIENFKAGGLAKYGLDYASLAVLNPRLIYCSITGFGHTGPLAQRPGYDFMIQGLGGLMSITGERDDLPGGGPQKAGVAISDVMTGMYATVAVLAALQERHNSGLGQYLDMALFDCHVAMLANHTSTYLTTGVPPVRMGNAHQTVVPYQVFAASDGHLIVAVGNDGQYRAYCKAIGAPELGSDPRFATNALRVTRRHELIPQLVEIMKTGTRDGWLAKLEAAGVPSGPINDIGQAFNHPQAQARELRREIPHPLSGTVPVTASPLRFSASPVQYRRAPPLLGQHTEEVLREVLGRGPAASK